MNFIFDVDETLYDMTQPFNRAFKEIWPEHKIDLLKLFNLSRKYNNQIFDKIVTKEMTVDEVGVYRIQRAMADIGIEISQQEALTFQKAYRNYQYDIHISPVIREMLRDLKDYGATLGVLTNGLLNHQMGKIRSMSLSNLISDDRIFVSEQIGFPKPRKEAFEYVEKKLKLDKATTWYIGDSIVDDLNGAKEAGWKMILFNRRFQDLNLSCYQPDFEVHDEVQLAKVIRSIICK